MDDRRDIGSYENSKRNQENYSETQKQIRINIKKAKGRWTMERCSEIEELQRKADTFGLHRKVKEMANIYRKSNKAQLRNDQGKPIKTEEELAKT